MACMVAEVVLTLMFLLIILGATDRRAPQGFAPIAIGLGLTLIHLIGITVTRFLGQSHPAAPVPRCSWAAGRSSNCGCSGWRPSWARRSLEFFTRPSPANRG